MDPFRPPEFESDLCSPTTHIRYRPSSGRVGKGDLEESYRSISRLIGKMQMPGNPVGFIDRHIFLHLLSADKDKTTDRAEMIVRTGGLISVQALKEIIEVRDEE